jgi:hypothetical protein
VGAGITWSNLPNDIAANQYRDLMKTRYFKPGSLFFPSELLKDKTKAFIEQTNCPVGIFVNRDFVKASNIILILDSEKDLYLLSYVRILLKATYGTIAILDRSDSASPDTIVLREKINEFIKTVKTAILLPEKDIAAKLLSEYNFMLISYASWNEVSENRKEALQEMPSTLIVNHSFNSLIS